MDVEIAARVDRRLRVSGVADIEREYAGGHVSRRAILLHAVGDSTREGRSRAAKQLGIC